ncbi:extracellular solute-binding protein [Paenibacillus sp. H1-7]|uniref:ABC transporter substrate-binding protein n=1 Tax=Paenibacillus sp. H1-7 TaxID=2282849 RepID=UPI001EF8D6A5|nr:extracellular solute-binding protein [Paenibacillus sp. H1-7]ULL16578.1 extracellular solute-binding protein [Paenibacillus sp. H1-7]
MVTKGLIVTTVLTTLIVSGCSERTDKSTSSVETVKEVPEPVKLTLYQRGANISDEEFRALIAEPVQKKYPYITVELVRSTQDASPVSLLSGGSLPDLLFANPGTLREIKELKAVEDLTELVRSTRFDLSRFESYTIDAIRTNGGDPNKLYGIPFSVNFSVLYYNKDIFDKFGEAYPVDGMTWDEVTSLARKVTRSENGQPYYGLHPADVDRMAGQLSIGAYDPNTRKATLTSEGWLRVFAANKAVWDIQGNQPGNNITAFMKDRNLAMMPQLGARLGELEDLHKQGVPLNWDMVSYPTFPEAPQTGSETDVHTLSITSTSKHKEAAFKVIEVVSEDATQLEKTRRGRQSGLKDPKYKESFGSGLQTLQGKHVAAIFQIIPAKPRFSDKYSDIAKNQIATAMNKVIKGEADINSALREAEELANKQIEAAINK